ncbi:hypothetical protein ACQUFE_18550, partial [Enterococcus casseliflavus]|uniref:hypothetical protein n=1 Tax=Enterococcus casseliflavus TaxID=37734 RepID=UPI003D1419B5
RDFMQVERKAPLVAIVASHPKGASDLIARMRGAVAARPHAFLLVHTLETDKKRHTGHGPVHLQGNIRVLSGNIAPYY